MCTYDRKFGRKEAKKIHFSKQMELCKRSNIHKKMIDFLENLEAKLIRQEKALTEECIRNETLDKEVKSYLEEYNVTEQQLSHFITHRDNFSEQNWKDLQIAKKEIEAKLQTELQAI